MQLDVPRLRGQQARAAAVAVGGALGGALVPAGAHDPGGLELDEPSSITTTTGTASWAGLPPSAESHEALMAVCGRPEGSSVHFTAIAYLGW